MVSLSEGGDQTEPSGWELPSPAAAPWRLCGGAGDEGFGFWRKGMGRPPVEGCKLECAWGRRRSESGGQVRPAPGREAGEVLLGFEWKVGFLKLNSETQKGWGGFRFPKHITHTHTHTSTNPAPASVPTPRTVTGITVSEGCFVGFWFGAQSHQR